MVKELDVIRAEQLLRQAETASGAFLDALTDEIAILDSAGTIIAVNEAWKRFARNENPAVEGPGVGLNYLDVCERAVADGVEDSRKVLDGLRSVLRKATSQFVMEYEFVTPSERRWFHLTATGLSQMPGALVAHRDITGARKVEEALRLGGQFDVTGQVFESFLPALVKNLAAALNVKIAFLSELVDLPNRRARMIATWEGTGFGDTREYRLEGKPAEQILAGKTCVFASGVRKLFPDDQVLARVEGESYMAVPLLDSSGQVLGHLGIVDTKPIEDVSFAETTLRVFAAPVVPELERRRIERRLAEQSRLIYSAPDAIVGTDDHFTITYWNRAAENTYGWRGEEVLGRDIREVLRTEFTDEDRRQAVQTVMEAGEYRGEVVQYRKDGTAINIGATTMPIRNGAGGLIGLVSINRDISERVLAEQRLRDAEAKTRAIVEAIPDMLFTVDARGKFLSFTPSKDLRPFVPPSEFLGKTVEEIMPPDVAALVMRGIGTCLRSGLTETVEYQLPLDGEIREFEARIVALGGDEVLAIVRDSTAEKRQARASQGRQTGPAVTRSGEKPCVLAVERDIRALRLVRRVLENAGKNVLMTSDVDEALDFVEMERPDVVLLDLAVFEDEEANVFSELRRLSDAPVLVLGAGEVEGGVRALRAGADDYITRPFSAAELDARVELALRHHRSGRLVSATPMEFGELVINPADRMVTVSGERVALTLTEYKLLLELADAAGRVMTHDEILDRVWGPGYAGQYEVLRTFVRTLRQKLGDDARQPRFLLSERGVGYRMGKG